MSKEISLINSDLKAIVSNKDFERVNKYKWLLTDKKYVRRNNSKLSLHRFILNAPKNMQVDHINHNTLDNRKQNLRLCTQSQNQMNQARHKKTLSKYKGVDLAEWKYKNKVYQYWRARIQINGKPILLGLFKSEIQAARGYDKAAKELFGEFAFINFKEEIK